MPVLRRALSTAAGPVLAGRAGRGGASLAAAGRPGGRAREGRTNAEIGAELFLSPRTVEWHMSNVFIKLGISSRGQLWHVLGADATMATP